MTAYVIVEIDITDPQAYEEVKRLTPPLVQAHGGKYLARGGTAEALEGDWQPKRVVLLEFPHADHARTWLDSPAYAPVKAIRHQAAHSRTIIVEGV